MSLPLTPVLILPRGEERRGKTGFNRRSGAVESTCLCALVERVEGDQTGKGDRDPGDACRPMYVPV